MDLRPGRKATQQKKRQIALLHVGNCWAAAKNQAVGQFTCAMVGSQVLCKFHRGGPVTLELVSRLANGRDLDKKSNPKLDIWPVLCSCNQSFNAPHAPRSRHYDTDSRCYSEVLWPLPRGKTSHANAQVSGVWKHRALATPSPMELFFGLMVVMVLFFSTAVASAWGENITCQCTSVCTLEAPGLGTLVTDGIHRKVDGGDSTSTVLLKRCCQCLVGNITCQCTSVCTLQANGPWHPPHRWNFQEGRWW